ncbi:MAG: hypothetical protein R3B90_01445 [Planctomycetaceae bacterium]
MLVVLAGCGGDSAPPASSAAPSAAAPAPSTTTAAPPVTQSPALQVGDSPSTATSPAAPPRISLGGGTSSADPTPTPTAGGAESARHTREEVLAGMQPLQILRDKWNAIRQKSIGSQDAGEEHNWLWDFRTNPKQPALTMAAPDSKYVRHLRLTYFPRTDEFQLTATGPDDQERLLRGTYSEPVQEVQLDGKKVHRTFKLELVEADPRDEKDQWRITLNQQENNRYLLQMDRKRGQNFQRFETISAQREGTSFALSDTDYGEKACIISGGLGTIQVSHNGKSYWVCCTGCKAAFEEEPDRWIADYEAKQKEQPAE